MAPSFQPVDNVGRLGARLPVLGLPSTSSGKPTSPSLEDALPSSESTPGPSGQRP